MESIATTVEIKLPSIYRYFSNKKHLFLEMYQGLLEEHYQQLKIILQNVKGKSTDEAVHDFIRCHIISFKYT